MKVLVASVAAVVLLAGCSSGKKAAPKLCDAGCQSNLAAADGSTLASVVPGVTIDDVSFLSVERKWWDTTYVDDKLLISLGHEMCAQFKAGKTIEQILARDMDLGATATQVGHLASATTTFYCPQYKSLLPA